jgi:hypothetical protein
MKEKIMKLSILVGIPVMTLLIMVGMASADRAFHHGINGVFAVSGISSCSPAGSASPVSPGVFDGDYTFRPDGTVSVSNGFMSNLPLAGPTMPVRGAFKYTVTREGRIEFQYPEYGFQIGYEENGNIIYLPVFLNLGPSHGVISMDGKTITITCGPPIGPLWLVDQDGTRLPDPNPDLWCVTSYTGVRIK